MANQLVTDPSPPRGLHDLGVPAHVLQRGRLGEQAPQHQRGDLVAELRRRARAPAAVEGQRPDQDAGDGLPGQRRVDRQEHPGGDAVLDDLLDGRVQPDPLLVPGGELGVAHDLLGVHAPQVVGGPDEVLDVVPHVPVEPDAGRAGAGGEGLGRGHGLVEIGPEDLLHDRALGGEVVEQRGLPDADRLRDLAGGRRVIAAPREQPRRLDQDALAVGRGLGAHVRSRHRPGRLPGRRSRGPLRHLVGEVAGRGVAGRHLPGGGLLHRAPLGAAQLLPEPAPGVEPAPRRRLRGVRRIAGQDDPLPPRLGRRVGHRHRRQQRHGVGMPGIGVEIGRAALLHDLPQIHNGYAMAEVADDREVVGDEQIGQPQFPLQLLQQVDDLRPDRHVERAHRLVGDDHRGVQRERPRQPHPLALPAGQLVRVPPGVHRRQPDHLEQLADPLAALIAGADVVDAERLGDARPGPPLRVERRRRVLEDHLELGPLRPVPAVLRVQRPPAEQDRPGRRADEPDDGAPERGLAAAGLADQPERLGRREPEGDAVHRVHVPDRPAEHRAPRDREVHPQIAHVEQRGPARGRDADRPVTGVGSPGDWVRLGRGLGSDSVADWGSAPSRAEMRAQLRYGSGPAPGRGVGSLPGWGAGSLAGVGASVTPSPR